jgi:hypothetical protein
MPNILISQGDVHNIKTIGLRTQFRFEKSILSNNKITLSLMHNVYYSLKKTGDTKKGEVVGQ